MRMGTPSDIGRDCHDAFLSFEKTCDKLGIAIWDFLGSRFKVAGHAIIERLDHYVRVRQAPVPRLLHGHWSPLLGDAPGVPRSSQLWSTRRVGTLGMSKP